MERIAIRPPLQQPREHDEPAGPSTCPVCGSPTLPLRELLRCSLCGFVLCEACAGWTAVR